MRCRSWVGVSLVTLFVVGCYAPPEMNVDGNLRVEGTELGEWNLDPAVCLTGAPIGFKGMDLSSRTGERCVRFVDDPQEGPLVVAFIPGTQDGRVFMPSDCDTFYVEMTRVVDQFDDVYSYGGVVDVDCATEDGALFGTATFEGCW